MECKNNKTCAFTGHRMHKLPGGSDEQSPERIELIKRMDDVILTLIEKMGVRHFITGMAIGVDMYAAERVLRLKDRYPDIRLEAAIPCRDQASRWSKSHRCLYERILSSCDSVTYLGQEYTSSCMILRNMYMVDNADYLFAVWDGSKGGTGNTVKYALKKQKHKGGITILRLDPNTLCLESISSHSYNGQIKII